MEHDGVILKSFALAGYRSFGKDIQRFEKLSKINLFIGQNNCGKSNILRFIHDVYPQYIIDTQYQLQAIDKPIINTSDLVVGISISAEEREEYLRNKLNQNDQYYNPLQQAKNLFINKATIDETQSTWFYFNNKKFLIQNNWEKAFEILDDGNLYQIWSRITGKERGDRKAHWLPETLERLKPTFYSIQTALLPAIRNVGLNSEKANDFSGEGLVTRLEKLLNPTFDRIGDRKKSEAIKKLLRDVTGNNSYDLYVPHTRDTIMVTVDGKDLPLNSLGTGIQEVIILAAAATVLENTVICMEEPELHLNPVLQKKLIRYLLNSTNNQYFISTHSAALLDTPDAEIYHIKLENGQSIVERATSDKQKSTICEDLGYHPSDLLQSNCVIWVEGPSDRIYLNWWIQSIEPKLIEGIHYSIMFYGGRLASHLTANDIGSINDFISLRRLNRRGVIIIDSDKRTEESKINETKIRLQDEFNQGPGHTWITQGKEIENYLLVQQVKDSILAIKPSAKTESSFGQYDNFLNVSNETGEKTSVAKVDLAKYITQHYSADLSSLDIKDQITKIIEFIRSSNPHA